MPGLNAKKILVLGVGRSGTTAIYNLLQQILEDQFPEQTDYVYEPFLWKRDKFNRDYREITNEFNFVDALSVEGMHHHKRLPMFCDSGSEISDETRKWLAGLFDSGSEKTHSLVKMIRANGRIDLIRQVVPDLKIIAVFRNPVDVINSVINLFSFFGDEFYESDYRRFVRESNVHHPLIANMLDDSEKVCRETAYWAVMNQHLIDCVVSNGSGILPVLHEQFVEERARTVRDICHLAEVEFKSAYIETAEQKVGPSRSEIGLSARQYMFVENRLNDYERMIARFSDFDVNSYLTRVRESYISSSFTDKERTRTSFFNSLHAHNRLKLKDKKISELQCTADEVNTLKKSLNARETSIRIKESQLACKESEIAEFEKKLTDKSARIQQLEEEISSKSSVIDSHQKELSAKDMRISIMRQKIDAESARFRQQSMTLVDREAAFEAKEKELAVMDSRIRKMQIKIESDTSRVLKQSVELASREAAFQEKEKELAAREEVIQTYEQELNEQNRLNRELQNELAAGSELLLKRESEIAEKNELILQKEKTIEEMTSRIRVLDTAVAAGSEELQRRNAEIALKNETIRKGETELNRVRAEKQMATNTLERDFVENQRILTDKQKNLQDLQHRIAQLTTSIKEHAHSRQKMELQLSEMSHLVEGQEKKFCEQTREHEFVVQALKSDICVQNDRLTQMNELLSELRKVTSFPVSQFDRKLRAYRNLLKTYHRVKPDWHALKNPDSSKRRLRRLKKRVEDYGVNLGDQLDAFYGNHRSGWAYAVSSLAGINNNRGIYLDTFIERTFCWSPNGVKTHNYPWVGFIHVPPFVPGWFQYKQSNHAIFETEAWKESLPYCRGLFTLSDYHKKFLQLKFDFPIESVVHPTEFPDQLWSWDAFKNNRNKRIIQLGWWLRKLHAIYQLPDSRYTKTLIRVNEKEYLKQLFQKEKEQLIAAREFEESMYDTVDVLGFLPNHEYDQLLSQNLVFLNLYDSSANNSVIECIARGTPLLINPIPPVKEYLGEEYPLYYDSYEEAIEKASDMELIRQTHQYLINCITRKKLTGEYFTQCIQQSDLLLNAYQV